MLIWKQIKFPAIWCATVTVGSTRSFNIWGRVRRGHVDFGCDLVWRFHIFTFWYRGERLSGLDWLNWYQMKEEEFLYPFLSQSSIGTWSISNYLTYLWAEIVTTSLPFHIGFSDLSTPVWKCSISREVYGIYYTKCTVILHPVRSYTLAHCKTVDC